MAVALRGSENSLLSDLYIEQRTADCALNMVHTISNREVTMPSEKGDTSWVKGKGRMKTFWLEGA